MKKTAKFVSAALALAMCCSLLPACGNGGDGNIDFGNGGKPVITDEISVQFWAPVDNRSADVYQELVDTFNAQHEGEISVRLVRRSSGFDASLSSTLQGSNAPGIVVVSDQYIKTYIVSGLLEQFDAEGKYLSNENWTEKNQDGTPVLDLSDMRTNDLLHFRYDAETYRIYEDAPLYGIPLMNCPTTLFYNKTSFAAHGVNIISVAEDELEDYNGANGTSFLPHGYYEYTEAPAQGLTQTNGVYRVFNDKISLNFEETVQLSRLFTSSGDNKTYGFLTEWWFSHGWSVGGDCIEWDEDAGKYVFTLGDDTPNYLVTDPEGLTVRETSYAAGDILSYNDKLSLSSSQIENYIAEETLYELPSQRDAFTEFCRLSQTSDKTVDGAGTEGYGVSPSPATLRDTSKMQYFTSGNVAMVSLEASAAPQIDELATFEWGVAPLQQWREYNADGTLKTVNGTPVVGKRAGHNILSSYCIPSNISENKKYAAWKFIEYAASLEGQKILAEMNMGVPNQVSYSNSEEYLNSPDAIYDRSVLVSYTDGFTMGDWSYLEDKAWIDPWANILNSDVRNGSMQLGEFFDLVEDDANAALSGYRTQA